MPQFPPRTPHPTPEALRALREGLGLSRPALAPIIQATDAAIEAWEAGRNRMPAGLWALLRARATLLRGDQRGALAVLRESLPAPTQATSTATSSAA